ncbi:MAG: glycoside hydrolase family 2 protein, partial [Oscillospiraceae bacterium]|nr:glycoside hydrolase family 2 protein [Oscillospiraceae bacterium]
MKQSLNGKWRLYNSSYDITADVPGSLYTALLKEGLMENPYYRENEYISTEVCDEGCTYEYSFSLSEEMKNSDRKLLKFHGIDTISTIYLNGSYIGSTNNMHREYSFDITSYVMDENNLLMVKIESPNKYIKEKNEKTPLWGVASTMAGYPHIRKAHYMFGWDWGPKLPDMGIWRNVELIGITGGLIDGVFVRQDHSKVKD